MSTMEPIDLVDSDEEKDAPVYDAKIVGMCRIDVTKAPWKNLHDRYQSWKKEVGFTGTPKRVTGVDIGSATPSAMVFDVSNNCFITGWSEDIRNPATGQDRLSRNIGKKTREMPEIFGSELVVAEQQVGMGADNQSVEMALFGALPYTAMRIGNKTTKEVWPHFFPDGGHNVNKKNVVAMIERVARPNEMSIIHALLAPRKIMAGAVRVRYNEVCRFNRKVEAEQKAAKKAAKGFKPAKVPRKKPVPTIPDDSPSHLCDAASIALAVASVILGFDVAAYRVFVKDSRLVTNPKPVLACVVKKAPRKVSPKKAAVLTEAAAKPKSNFFKRSFFGRKK